MASMMAMTAPFSTRSPGFTSLFQTLPPSGGGFARPGPLGGARRPVELALGLPVGALRFEGGLAGGLEGADALGVLREELAVFREAEGLVLDGDLAPAEREVAPPLRQLLGGDREELHLVEEAQQPGLALGEGVGLPPGVPDLDRPAEQLVPAGPLHAVDAHV